MTGGPNPPGDMNNVSDMLGLLSAVLAQMAGYPGNSTVPTDNAANVTAVQALLGNFPGPGLAPSSDATGATDSTNIANLQNLCGVMILQRGQFYTNAPIKPDTRDLLQGYGDGTIISPGSGFSGSYMVELAHAATTVEVTIRDFQLAIGYASGVGGVQLDNTGYTNPGGATGLSDTLHTVENILVVKAGGDGFHLDNNIRELRCRGCKAYEGLGYGFFLGNSSGSGSGCTDSHFTDCTSGPSADHGWYVLDANNMFTSCKAFGAGYNQQTAAWGSTQAGFEIASTVTNGVFTGCSAQQNALYGFDLQGCNHTVVVGSEADSNGAGSGTPTGIGINVNAATQCVIMGNTGSQFITPGNQVFGIQQNGASYNTYYAFNSLYGSTSTFNFAGGSGYYLLDGTDVTDFTAMRNVRLGSPQLYETTASVITNGSTVTISNSAGSYPLNPAANVTGIILAKPPSYSAPGQFVILINISAYTITFAAAGTSFVAGGTANVIQAGQAAAFVYDTNNALWYPTAG